MVPGRPGISFVEYESDVQSTVAMQGLQGFKLATDKPMKVGRGRGGGGRWGCAGCPWRWAGRSGAEPAWGG